jgi:threonine/homoserine/homoserine lactone efflux protein
MRTSLNNGQREAMLTGLGSLAAEFIVCYIAIAATGLISNPNIMKWIGVAATPILVILGLIMIFKKDPEASLPTEINELKESAAQTMEILPKRSRGPLHAFVSGKLRWLWTGFSLNVINPLLLPFWILMASTVQSQMAVVQQVSRLGTVIAGGGWISNLTFALGASSGHFVFLQILSFWTVRTGSQLTPALKSKINRGIGIFFVGVAIYQGINIAQKYFLNP